MSCYLGHTTTIKIYFDNYNVGNYSVANKNVKLLLFIERNKTILIELNLFKPFFNYYDLFFINIFSGLYVANFYGINYNCFVYSRSV